MEDSSLELSELKKLVQQAKIYKGRMEDSSLKFIGFRWI
jgi:hypothetical protein